MKHYVIRERHGYLIESTLAETPDEAWQHAGQWRGDDATRKEMEDLGYELLVATFKPVKRRTRP